MNYSYGVLADLKKYNYILHSSCVHTYNRFELTPQGDKIRLHCIAVYSTILRYSIVLHRVVFNDHFSDTGQALVHTWLPATKASSFECF